MGSCGSETRRCSVCGFIRLLVRAIAVGGLMWILMVGSNSPETTESMGVGSTKMMRGTADQAAVGAEKVPKLDLINYMSKRRVPNGPDPIHNRRAGKSGKPPGQA